MKIMLMNGQKVSAESIASNLEIKIKNANAKYLLPNLEAVKAFHAMRLGNYEITDRWLGLYAPDENAEFCTLDRFQYFIKLRMYLIYEKYVAFMALAERLMPVLEAFDRSMEICEFNILYAVSFMAQNEKENAFRCLEKAIKIGEKRNLKRLFADEGAKVYLLLKEYKKENESTPFLDEIYSLSEQMAVLFPNYMKSRQEDYEKLSKKETEILHLLADDRTNEEISEFLDISITTVKSHVAKIFKKLDVKNRSQAVSLAKKIGIL